MTKQFLEYINLDLIEALRVYREARQAEAAGDKARAAELRDKADQMFDKLEASMPPMGDISGL